MTKKATSPISQRKKKFNMNIGTSDELRKAFKAKFVMNGKTVKDVIEEFMKEYIKK